MRCKIQEKRKEWMNMKKIFKSILVIALAIVIVAGTYGRPNRPGGDGTGSNSVIETEENVEM